MCACQQDAPEELTRETWMTELPPELQHIGLGARTFKKRSGPEKADRSIWTDTPADRERKARVFNENRFTFYLLHIFASISFVCWSLPIGTFGGKEEG